VGLDGAFAAAQDVGDVVHRAVLDVAQDDGAALLIGQLTHESPELGVVVGGSRSGGRRADSQESPGLALAPAMDVDRRVQGHATHPGAGLVEVRDALPVLAGLGQRFLGDVLSRGDVASQGAQHRDEPRVLPAEEVFERHDVACCADHHA